MANLSRRLAAEALGTGMLVATVVGSGIMAERGTGDATLALLANTLPTGAMLVVLITLLGPLSGAHFNPAVSLVMWLRRELRADEAAAYSGAQVLGGIAGTVMAHLMFEAPIIAETLKVRSGLAQWLSEGIATFGLVAVILLGIAHARTALPWLVGLYITAAYWFTASTSFANPAVTFARALTDSFSGIRLLDVPAFISAQLLGAGMALLACRWLASEQRPSGNDAALVESAQQKGPPFGGPS